MKNHNEKVSAQRMTVAVVIMLLSLFTLLKTGNAVSAVYDGFYYLFGSITSILLGIIIYAAIQYMIDSEYKFYKSKTFWSLFAITIGVFIFSTKAFGINSNLDAYTNRLDNAYSFNGGFLGYVVIKPFYTLVGNIGLDVIGIIAFLIGGYGLYTQFYEVDEDFSQIAKKKLTPTKVTKEQRMAAKNEREFIRQERLARKELENAKPTFEVGVKKEDPKSHMLNLRIEKEKDFEIKEVKPKSKSRPKPRPKPVEEDNFEIKEVKPNQVSKPAVAPKSVAAPVVAETVATVEPHANVNVMKIEQSVEKKVAQTGDYKVPPIDLLSDGMKDLEALKRLETAANENAKVLEMTLDSFNLKAKIINVSIGPNITKYELQPEIGTKVSKFSSLSNDLAMALAATSIRIEAPIPGKAAVGIEIPNKEVLSVSLKEVLLSQNNDMDKKLQVALGKDITGESIFMEINKTPHMLVAGATGSGKSVSINSFILSILLKSTPDEVKMIMIDPKKVELAPYNGIPHLLTPVVTEPKRAAVILKKMVLEMETRYELFSKTNTRNIEGFNTKIKKSNPDSFKELPYIVIIIDELADLMMVASNEVETSIARLAQMARAAGIHLVIATQRPSTDIITGLIKSNIPTRLSFSVSSSIDSRTILDQSGAEKLLGKGDMLYAANGSNNLNRIQGTFVSDEEIIEVVEFITEQEYGKAELEAEQAQFEATIKEADEMNDRDELFEEAVEVILAANSASTSLLQRRLRIGFNRASSIMEQMEDAGIVSANEGTKPRRILISSYGEENE
ncbi:DNA translocase FtsK [Mollicutes bacterium LVI A0078]|nr:DNA translocase FtsK [Mollicutes bacterium LVI A0075]WOO90962.1 DNA translocase FtsK [Mollicutes bacterium LVI A0078]